MGMFKLKIKNLNFEIKSKSSNLVKSFNLCSLSRSSNENIDSTNSSQTSSSNYKQLDSYIKEINKDLLWISIKKASRQEFKYDLKIIGKKKISQLKFYRRKKQIEEGISFQIFKWDKKIKTQSEKTSNLIRHYQIKTLK